MNLLCRSLCVLLFTAVSGCYFSGYHERLASRLVRSDGTTLHVECVSNVKHDVRSISPTLAPKPTVTVVVGDLTFVVHEREVLLNDQQIAAIAGDAKEVRFEITSDGFEVLIDGRTAAAEVHRQI